MKQSLIIVAVVNALLAAFMFSKVGGTGQHMIDLDAPSTKNIYRFIGSVYAVTALTLIAAVSLV